MEPDFSERKAGRKEGVGGWKAGAAKTRAPQVAATFPMS